MSFISSIVDSILKLHGPAAYALVGGLAFAEAALLVGFVLPGETAVLLGGVLAYRHKVSLPLIAAVAVLAAITGDSVGYEGGRHFGSRLLKSRVFAKRQKGLEKGQRALRDNGGRAVFFARFTAFLRAVMPGMAGTARMPYPGFWRSTPQAAWSGRSASPCWVTSPAPVTNESKRSPATSA